MTVQTTTRTAGPYAGDDVSTTFPFAFKVLATTDVVVTTLSDADVESTLTLSTDYTVTLNPDQNTSPGGNITLVTPLSASLSLTITSSTPLTQQTEINNLGGFFPQVLENALDKLTIIAIELAAAIAALGGGGSSGPATTTTLGTVKLSVSAAAPASPYAVGTNDLRVTADQNSDVASIRTLGIGSLQAAPGDHAHVDLQAQIDALEDANTYHANLVDTDTDGHPDTAITLATPESIPHVSPASTTLRLALVDLANAITDPTVHNSLTGRSTASAHPATAVSFDPTGLVNLSAATVQAVLAQVDAALSSGGGVLRSVLAANTTAVNNSTALVDSGLSVSVAANKTYKLTGFIIVDSGTTPDLKYGFSGPAGATLTWITNGIITGTASAQTIDRSMKTIGSAPVAIGVGAGAGVVSAMPFGTLITSATAGTFKLQFAQNTADVSDTKILAGSWIELAAF